MNGIASNMIAAMTERRDDDSSYQFYEDYDEIDKDYISDEQAAIIASKKAVRIVMLTFICIYHHIVNEIIYLVIVFGIRVQYVLINV